MKSLATKLIISLLGVLSVLGVSGFSFALDREAFSITNYDLNLQIDPAQHRLGVRGKITLRNDSSDPQKVGVLQISSSLDWRSIKVDGKPVQYLTQPFASDIDHTGGLSEAIVTLSQPVPPHRTVDLEIGYEGVIVLDATRLTRIGTPEDAAKSSDWDQISPDGSAIRGVGYVAWYPIATDVANLSEGDSLFEVLNRWKTRESGSLLKINLEDPRATGDSTAPIPVCNGKLARGIAQEGASSFAWAQCSYADLGHSVPSLALAHYGIVNRPSMTVFNLPSHAAAAEAYADAAEKAAPLINDWFGSFRDKAQTVDLIDDDSAPFETASLLFTPLANSSSNRAGLSAAHQLTHAAFYSPRPWIEEGLAHFAQALLLEQWNGRESAIDYMAKHRSVLNTIEESESEPGSPEQAKEEANRALVSTSNEALYRSKSMCVWWMLRDMIGPAALKKAIAAYRPDQDKEPSYMPRLIAAQTQRDLEWFFDDWVYRDHGLPDFKVESAFARKTLNKTFILTVTIDNLGRAGAEVPVIVKFARGETKKRLEVHAKDKATFRLETPAAPDEILVNDGSVPERDTDNNTFKVPPPES
ncbi:MAG TPA: hypothetical protein VMB66_11490 [Candidatus Acidoferrales bacterium]|nr:hypothetical protein [Candidatus Acidoferrales bacterium]